MNRTKKQSVLKVIANSSFLIIAFIALFPIIGLLFSSFRPSSDLMRDGITLSIDFSQLNLANYKYIFEEASQYWTWYGNSLLVSGLTIVLSLFFSSMVGYALAVYDFKGRNLFFVLVLLILMIPFEILMLPLYQMIVSMQLIDSTFAVVLPMIVAPVAVFFFRQYALGLPKELMDAARIDGSTEYGIFFRIIVVPQAFFSGLFSLENAPVWVEWIGNTMPINYGASALVEVMIKGNGMGDILLEISMLLGFSFLFFILNLVTLVSYRK